MKIKVEVVSLVDLNRIVTRKETMLIQMFMTNIVKTTIMTNVRFIKEVLHQGGCYLTSACMVSKCLPDDCYELETLRTYRDTWLKSTEEGLSVIAEYYAIAPKIVEAIDKRDDSNKVYDMLYEKMVLPCVRFIEEKKYQETLELYRRMTLKLKEEYC